MRILYISQYFPPEVNAPAQRVMDFAREWTRAGHKVTVITGFPNHPAGKVYDGYKLRLVQRETIDGVKVVRTYLYPTPNKGVLLRCINYSSFMASAVLAGGPVAGRADVVIASCPQLLVGVAGWIISKAKRAPFVLEVRDVWPEALRAVGINVNDVFYAALARLTKFLYARASRIVVVTEGARDTIAKHGVDRSKMLLIPSGVRLDPIASLEPEQIRRDFGDGDRVLVSYIGTHGLAQGLSSVLDAAGRLKHDQRIQFLFIGDGAEKEDLVRRKEALGLSNVCFLDHMPQTEAQRYIAASDICLVPLRKAELFNTTIPSKLYNLMACARPIVLSVDGEARELVEQAGAGVYVEPENSPALADAILKLANDPIRRAELGASGRRFVAAHYDKTKLAGAYLDLLQSLTI